jgi:hypothetical protein
MFDRQILDDDENHHCRNTFVKKWIQGPKQSINTKPNPLLDHERLSFFYKRPSVMIF